MADCDCPPDALWEPDPANGLLEFLDHNYEIPNHAVRFVGAGGFPFYVAEYVGEDVEVVDGVVAQPRVEKGRTAPLELQMTFWATSDGTAHCVPASGFNANWRELNGLSSDSLSDPSGLTELRYTPYTGATAVTFTAHVLPPVPGEVTQGKGMTVGMVIVLHEVPSGFT